MSVAALEPSIRQILCAPGTDLNTISAKRVRKQLLELEPDIEEDWVKANKEQIDALIATVYEGISAAATQGDVSSDPGASKRKREEDGEEAYDGDGGGEGGDDDGDSRRSSPPPKPKKSKSKRELTDEELARQLSHQLNGPSRTSRSATNGKTRPKKPSAKSTKRAKKSAERVTESDDESEVDSDGEKKRKKKKSSGGGGAKGGFQKEFILRFVHRFQISYPVLGSQR